MRIILLGPPGCGKGTQGELIEKKYGFPRISSGDLLREAVARRTSLGKIAEKQMKRGELVEDEIVVGLVRERILEDECRQGYILDGFPRNISQAERLEESVGKKREIVVEIQVPEDILIERLTARRICEACGAIFHLQTTRPKREGACDFCGGKLIQREDDRPEVVRERLKVYRQKTEPLLGYYQRKKCFFKVDGSGVIEEIFTHISSLLDSRMGEHKESEVLR